MMNKILLTEFKDGEYWYGGIVSEGNNFPLSAASEWEYDLSVNKTVNQMTCIFLSTQGRVIGADKGFKIYFSQGKIYVDDTETDIKLYQAKESNLKAAYYLAKEQYFPFEHKNIPCEMYNAPQFNTWIQLLYNQNQTDILDYAKQIIAQGYTPGVLMIDDGWSPYYGNWVFAADKFSDPAEMIASLHQLGFKIMLWVCPHVSPDSLIYRELVDKDYFVKTSEGEIAIRQWWNGYSAMLDLSNPQAMKWLKQQLDNLVINYGVDGFKFDAGDARFYQKSDITYGNVTPNEQSNLWADFGDNYRFNELRAAVDNGGKALVQRLADKAHSWEIGGIKSLIPHQLIQSLFGYPFNCPDMIGGGEYLNFLANKENLDEELFVRHAQISCLMPMMQFSAAPWKYLDAQCTKLCLAAAKYRGKFNSEIQRLFMLAKQTGTPITTPLEFYFPHQNLQNVQQQFMLGEKYLVAPVIKKGEKVHTVVLPKGLWKDEQGVIYQGGQIINIKVTLSSIPVFELIAD